MRGLSNQPAPSDYCTYKLEHIAMAKKGALNR